MILVDTGYIIALVSVDDEHHGRAFRWTLSLTEPLVVTEFVLVETVNALSKISLRPRAIDVIEAVQIEPQFVWIGSSPDLLELGTQRYRARLDKAWSLTDCISFVVMEQRDITRALAHDHHFEQAGFEALLRRDP